MIASLTYFQRLMTDCGCKLPALLDLKSLLNLRITSTFMQSLSQKYLEQLTEIDSKALSPSTFDDIKILSKLCPQVKKLNLTELYITEKNFEDMAQVFPNMTHLHLKHPEITESSLESLKKMKSLEVLTSKGSKNELNTLKKSNPDLVLNIEEISFKITDEELSDCLKNLDLSDPIYDFLNNPN